MRAIGSFVRRPIIRFVDPAPSPSGALVEVGFRRKFSTAFCRSSSCFSISASLLGTGWAKALGKVNKVKIPKANSAHRGLDNGCVIELLTIFLPFERKRKNKLDEKSGA